MPKKTQFEEIYSLVKFTDQYKDIIFYIEDLSGLIGINFAHIIRKEGNLLSIIRSYSGDIQVDQIPIHKVWLIVADNEIILDRRKNYQGPKDLSIPELKNISSDPSPYLPLIQAVHQYNWTGELSERLFSNITHLEKNGLHLYNYNQRVLVDRDHPILIRCRGLILTGSGKVVNYPFDRFFNHFEKEANRIDWNSAWVLEKVDGSLICVFHYDNEWQVTTRGAFYPLLDTNWVNFEVVFRSLFKSFDKLDSNLCYMFEIVSQKNPNITFYNEEYVVLIGIRNVTTLEEILPSIDITDHLEVRHPNAFKAMNLDDCLNLLKNLKDDEEGLVVVDKKFNRIKIKQESFFKLMKIKELNEQELFEYVIGLSEIDAELIQRDLAVVDKISQIRSHWENVSARIEEIYVSLTSRDIDRKEFAVQALKYPFKSVLFAKLDSKPYMHKLAWDAVSNW